MVNLLSSKTVVFAGLGAAAFVGYCIYFDRKRRSAPGYKDSIRQRRRIEHGETDDLSDLDLDLRNPTQIHNFFIREMQLGEMLLEQGQIDEGALHLANAIVFSGQPQQIMSLLQQTMSPGQYAAVANKIPIASQRLNRLTSRMTVEENPGRRLGIEEELDDSQGEEIEVPKMQDIMQDDDLE